MNKTFSKKPFHFYQFSDLDLCCQEDIPSGIVELVKWKNMRPAFQKDLTLLSAPAQTHQIK